ncbi:tellurite resistance TerB family protein [Methylobacterium sp. J-048]|uniref:tellurite resistance TerB family protein n=1 Tax=Methylobacterium sp. J-048 TaxID=2836635 RepID=UPI001FBA09B7|nr:tellurite resistance TerB family protein [Methylobacterium sp. J-048]MCJ2055638.1 tellurite resistance TerB family protein [Methylobacterium sp. J-048]
MNALKDLLTRFGRTVTAYAGDEVLMQAGISAAANVIVADGEVAGDEFETALVGLRANPIIEKGYDLLMLEEALYESIARARTRAGRVENLRRVAAIAGRPMEQRQDAFLVAFDVADHEGISEIEDKALTEIAAALIVNKPELMQTAVARTTPSPSAA